MGYETVKLYLEPQLETCANGGIRRVVEAQYKYLPEFGIELTTDPNEAEVEAAHVIGKPKNPNNPFVLHNHGAMWREYNFPAWAEQVNRDIVDSMHYAYAITSPSNWVTRAIGRGTYKPVQTIYHGVDPEEWKPAESHANYVLWNKARTDEVSNADDMQRLAELLPEVEFVSTFGRNTDNVGITGQMSNEAMKEYVQNAGLYLCTARETFGIGTLESLSSGVPVIGWDYGGQSEIIRNSETGYLAKWGDYQELADVVRRALAEQARLSRNARMDVVERWQWRDKIGQYAELYKSAAAWYHAPRPKVSVIVPAHNLAKYLPYTLQSIQQQTLTDFECLIIDDQSSDETPEIARAIVEVDLRFRYHRTKENLKLSNVRNYGAQSAFGKYLCYVDADDMLTPQSLAIQSMALDTNREIDIAYGSLDLINEEGTHTRRNSFPAEFNWYRQMAHQNQIPTGAMMRREVVEQSGGWRSRQWRAEDAEFWSRVTSLGYRAEKVTNETTLLYRVRSDSKGSTEFRTLADRDGNWLANISWRSANSAQEGIDYLSHYGDNVPQERLVPFGAQGQPKGNKFWSVYHYQDPVATIIVEGNDHLEDTLDSLMGQYQHQWEVWVVGKPLKGFPYVIWVDNIDQVKPRGQKVYTIQAGEMFPNDWLSQDNPLDLQVNPLDGKVLLEYTGQNLAPTSIRINGWMYKGYQGAKEWVKQEDAEKLIARGSWHEVKTNWIPEAQLADQRQ